MRFGNDHGDKKNAVERSLVVRNRRGVEKVVKRILKRAVFKSTPSNNINVGFDVQTNKQRLTQSSNSNQNPFQTQIQTQTKSNTSSASAASSPTKPQRHPRVTSQAAWPGMMLNNSDSDSDSDSETTNINRTPLAPAPASSSSWLSATASFYSNKWILPEVHWGLAGMSETTTDGIFGGNVGLVPALVGGSGGDCLIGRAGRIFEGRKVLKLADSVDLTATATFAPAVAVASEGFVGVFDDFVLGVLEFVCGGGAGGDEAVEEELFGRHIYAENENEIESENTDSDDLFSDRLPAINSYYAGRKTRPVNREIGGKGAGRKRDWVKAKFTKNSKLTEDSDDEEVGFISFRLRSLY